jgi:hypothetical protein
MRYKSVSRSSAGSGRRTEHGREPAPANFRSVPMPKKPIKIEVVQEGDERFLLKIFADGGEEREPIVKLPRKPPRFPYRKVTFDESRKRGF